MYYTDNTADFQAIATMHIIADPIARTREANQRVFMATSRLFLREVMEYCIVVAD